MLTLRKMAAILVPLLAVACSDGATTARGGGGSATGGSGGSAAHPWDKPVCDNPNQPAGGAPSARSDTAGVLTPDGEHMIIFGGDQAIVVCGATPKRDHVGDTWLLDVGCGRWTELQLPVAPQARARHAMVYDAARERALLFGGRTREAASGPYTLFNDLWAFDLVKLEWSQITTTGTAPSPRANTAVAIAGDELYLFGGNTSTSGLSFTPHDDTYVLNLLTHEWSQLTTTGNPPKRLFHTAVFDPETRRLFVIAGGDENAFLGPFYSDLWALDVASGQWFEIPTQGIPSGDLQRIKGGAVFRPPSTYSATPALITFGGHDNTSFADVRNDARLLDLGTLGLPQAEALNWATLHEGDVYNKPAAGICDLPADYVITDQQAPERRQGFALGQLPDGGAFVVFAGDSDCGRLNDVWWLNTDTGVWTPVDETLPGLTCPRTGNPNCLSLCN